LSYYWQIAFAPSFPDMTHKVSKMADDADPSRLVAIHKSVEDWEQLLFDSICPNNSSNLCEREANGGVVN